MPVKLLLVPDTVLEISEDYKMIMVPSQSLRTLSLIIIITIINII